MTSDPGVEPGKASPTTRDSRRFVITPLGATIVTSQLPLSAWHDVIGDPTYADAILDRLVHNAHRIELAGESLRRARGKPSKTT